MRLINVVRIAEFECVSCFCHRRQFHIGIAKISLRRIYASICWSFPVKHMCTVLNSQTTACCLRNNCRKLPSISNKKIVVLNTALAHPSSMLGGLIDKNNPAPQPNLFEVPDSCPFYFWLMFRFEYMGTFHMYLRYCFNMLTSLKHI